MKYEVKGLFSYGVYDGDRLLTTYESEKTAQCVAEALNDEAARVEPSATDAQVDKDAIKAAGPGDPFLTHGHGAVASLTDGLTETYNAARDLPDGRASAVSDPLYKAEQAERNANLSAAQAGISRTDLPAGTMNSGLSNGQDKETT